MMKISTKMFFLHLLEDKKKTHLNKFNPFSIVVTKQYVLFSDKMINPTSLLFFQESSNLVRDVCYFILIGRRKGLLLYFRTSAKKEKEYKIWVNPQLWFLYWKDYQIVIDQALDEETISSIPQNLEEIVKVPLIRDFVAEKVFHVYKDRNVF